MKCPNDDTTLIMSERQNIEIDYCPTCRGVWLDRGELDKIIERSQGTDQESPAVTQPSDHTYTTDDKYYHQGRPEHDQYYKKKKRESFLGDLFDL